jgi:glycosyltransferase involved in cell wall biosynthesis
VSNARGIVSTIIPVHNRATMLQEAVASVMAQTYRPIEVIIVDDESTDDTPHVITELSATHPEIRALRRSNGGPGLARETGRLEARGNFIQYLDSDDLLLPRKFELQVAALDAQPEAGIAYGLVRYRDGSGKEIECNWKPANQVQQTIFPSFLIARWWETLSPLYRRSVTDAVGPWTTLRLEEDWEYDCHAGALGMALAYVGEVVGEHRDHSDGRLSRGAANDPVRLRDRSCAHELITAHARRAGIDTASPEFQRFARELFHLGRQCGAAGLVTESRRLVALARSVSGAADIRAYALLASIFGWQRAGRIAASLTHRLTAVVPPGYNSG